MKRSKLILLIVFLVLLAAVVYLLRTGTDKETFKPIFTADSTAVSRIEIANRDTSITFVRKDSRWKITQPIKWDVEENHFSVFLAEVIHKQYSPEPVASGKDALATYALTPEKALRIKVFDTKDKLLREVWFGDLGNPFDYFCYKGGTDVYQIRSKVVSLYGPNLDSWRTSYALSIFSDEMLSIKVKHSKNSYELTRDGATWHYQDKLEDFDIPPRNLVMGKILNALSMLGSNTMLSGNTLPPEGSVPAPECEVEVMLKDNSKEKISFHPWEDKYLMKIDRYPDSYFVMLFDTVFRFTRYASLFRAVEGDPTAQ